MSDDVVVRAKAALEGVTAGPWRTVDGDNAEDATVFVNVGPSLFWCPDCGTDADAGRKEAEFVVSARSLVPELVAELVAARAEAALARDGLDVRPMTATESNLMTQVLKLRRELAEARAAVGGDQ